MKQFFNLAILLALLATSGLGYAQSTIDYETVGNSWTWTTFENGANPNTFSIVANPAVSGINTSANSAMFIANADGQQWAGFQCAHGEFGPLELTASNHIVKIMVYKSVISDVGIKFVTATGWAQPEIKVPNTLMNQWEELTFDFSPYIGIPGQPGPYDQIVIFPDYVARTTDNTCYIDNISFPGAVPVTIIVSTHSLTMAQAANSTATFDITTAIGWTVASDQTWLTTDPASGTGNATITLTAEANPTITPRTATVTVTGVDLTTQVIAVTQEGLPSGPATPAPTPPARDASDVISFFSDAYTNVTGTDFAPGWGQNTVVSEITVGTAVKKYENFNYIGIDFSGNHQDASAMIMLHVDIYTADETNIRITPISPGPFEFPTVLSPLTQNEWNSYEIPLSSFTGVVMSDLFQFKFDGGTGHTFYMDNLFLYKGSLTAIFEQNKSGISVYPNPVTSNLFVNGSAPDAIITILDMNGRVMISKQFDNSEINTNNLPKGIYTIRITENSGITTKKFVKE